MPSIALDCEDCDNKFILKYRGKDDPQHCPFCGSHIYLGEEIEPDLDEHDDVELDDEWE